MKTLVRTLAAAALAGAALTAFTPRPLVLAAQAILAGGAGDAAPVTRLTVHHPGAGADAGAIGVERSADEAAFELGGEADPSITVELTGAGR